MSDEMSMEIAGSCLNTLEHAVVAYRYSCHAIPNDQCFVNGRTCQVGGFVFQNEGQARSMKVELGWAFFLRLEANLEAFVARLGLPVKGPYGILDHLVTSGVEITDDYRNGLREYRELRNILHHVDGDPSLLRKAPEFVLISQQHEPHLLERHIERFYELFRWLGGVLPSTIRRSGRA